MTIAYLRVSTQKQCLENQRNEIEKFARHKGLVIHRWEMETISGTTAKSDRALGHLLGRMKKDDVIIVSEISRLSRKMLEIMSIFYTCIEKEVLLYSIKEGYEFGNNMNSKIMGFAFGISAEIERNLISMRTREALALRREQGIKLGRPKNSCTQQKRLDRHRTEIRQMLREGTSVSQIARTFGVARNTLYSFLRTHDGI